MLERVRFKIDVQALLTLFGLKVNEAIAFGRSISLVNWNQLTSLGANGLATASTAVQLYRIYKNDDSALRQISQEHESAVNSYREAQRLYREGSVPNAIATVDAAMREFHETSSHNRRIVPLESHKLFHANLLLFKGILLFTSEKYADAIDTLKESLAENRLQPLALNLLAFINIYHLPNIERAKKYLARSLAQNPKQVFAAFYSAHLKRQEVEDAKADQSLDEAFASLRHTFTLKEGKSDEEAEKLPEVMNLAATTLPIFTPYMAMEWLAHHTERENNRRELANMAAIFSSVLSNCQTLSLEQCRTILLERRVAILQKIASLRGSEFETFDNEWRAAHSLVFHAEARLPITYFYNYPVEGMDHAVLKRLPHGTNVERLTSPGIKNAFIEYLIVFAKLGRFSTSQNPVILPLVALIKRLKKEDLAARVQTEREIQDCCSKPAVIDYFLETYLTGKGWAPWFNVLKLTKVDGTSSSHSLIQLACRDQAINLYIYKLNNEGKLTPEQTPVIRRDSGNSLHLLVSSDSDQLSLLAPLTAPGDIYRWLARRDCLTLLTLNPTHAKATQVLGERRLASIPTSAQDLLATETTRASRQLRLFTRRHGHKKNLCTYENTKAEFQLAVAHTQYEELADFDLTLALKNLIESSQPIYAECARVLHARLYYRGTELNIANTRVDALLETDTGLTQSWAKALRLLLVAEYNLHGYKKDNVFYPPKHDIVLKMVSQFFVATNNSFVITPQQVSSLLPITKFDFLKSYCIGYAAALLAGICRDIVEANRYYELAQQFGFYRAKQMNLEQISREILGMPQCSNVKLDLDRYDELSAHELNAYAATLRNVYQESTLFLPPKSYINYALVSLKMTPPWFQPSHAWFVSYTSTDEAWLSLRDYLNGRVGTSRDYLLLYLEANPGKPPFSLHEISLNLLSPDEQVETVTHLLRLLNLAGIKIDDYAADKRYDAVAFKKVADSYHVEEKPSCRIS